MDLHLAVSRLPPLDASSAAYRKLAMTPALSRRAGLACAVLLATSALTAPTMGLAQAKATADAPAPDALAQGFVAPPESAKPRVWWHWLSGNVSKPGITADLEWMKRVGLGGMQMFDGDMGAPKVVDHRIAALTPEWRDHLRFAASEADRLDLEFGMAAAPGWSETGGPWVQPEAGMKKVVWAETQVVGGKRLATALNAPPRHAGPFQDSPHVDFTGKPLAGPEFFQTISVLAYRRPQGDVPLATLAPKITAQGVQDDASLLIDGKLDQAVVLDDPKPGAPVIVRFDFDKPQAIRGLTYAGPVGDRFNTGPGGRIEASQDGQAWSPVAALTGAGHNPAPQRTFAFPETTARHFRVVFDQPATSENPWPRGPVRVAELALTPGARVNHFEDKAGFGVAPEDESLRTPAVAAAAAIPSKAVIDLTGKLKPDGTLDWTPPKGDWSILWLGYSLTGEVNHPATPEATGLEVDKLNAAHVRGHLDAYLGPVAKELNDLIGAKGLKYILTDSWEAGDENWTEAMVQEFKTRRGYDPTPFLPVLTGRVVDSAQASDAFLWDFRRTLADLLADNHYGAITRYAKEHGLGYYGEATGAAWPTVADGMLAKSLTDIPMGEFWDMPFGGEAAAFQGVRSDEFPADIVETASTAHVYGKSLVAAESFTSSQPLWTRTPWTLKWVADRYMAMGVNRLVIHTSPHQPDTAPKPGLTLGPFGQTFTRNETWGELAKPWVDYLARGSFMLQQGAPVADLLFFYGEGAPSGVPYREAAKPGPVEGHGYDYVNADALLRLAKVENGKIVFPGGAAYSALVLPDTLDRMTLPMVQKLTALVEAGGVVVGPRPQGSPSLASEDAAVNTAALKLWGQTDGRVATRADFGKGRVYWGRTPAEVLQDLGVGADFDYARPSAQTKLMFAHRHLDDGEIYFVTNQTGRAETLDAAFRVAGKAPELWRADTGQSRATSYRIENGRTTVPLTLAPYDAVFVVFRKPATASAATVAEAKSRKVATVAGPWSLSFPAGWGAPAKVEVPALGSWTDNASPDIKYFSGIGTYSRTLKVDAAWLKSGQRLTLDLGQVGDVAEVWLNGQRVGGVWKAPYQLDVTQAAKAGDNQLVVKVGNVWLNRFVGDHQPGATKRAFTNASEGGGFSMLGTGIGKDTPLTPSGLIGPVTLWSADR
jgi:hypothetical protein